jgi:hypothetical protein
MNSSFKIYADFNNADSKGRIRLNTQGTSHDLKEMGIQLEEGLKILLDDDEGIVALGIVSYSEDEQIWVAEINWQKIM